MKVVHISTADWLGGAARAAYRLHAGLQSLNEPRDGISAAVPIQSSMLVASRMSGDPSVIQFRPGGGIAASALRRMRRWQINWQLQRACRSKPGGFESFNVDRSAYQDDELVDALPNCDLVNLHWVSQLLDCPTFLPKLCRTLPVVWTLHDMNVLTGGCHYDDGCGRFLSKCGLCPQLGSGKENDLAAQVWKRKQETFAMLPPDRLHIVTPSKWLAGAARSSSILNRFEVTVIPYGLDTQEFCPIGKAICRDALGIPARSRVVLFVAQSSAMHRKGFEPLRQALAKLTPENLVLLSVGGGGPVRLASPAHEGSARSEVGTDDNGSIRRLHLGNIENDRLLALAYGAADVFVIPSVQDNLPNTVLESMACGTPVAGFNVGGIPDMVRQGETGELAPAGDVNGLASAIGGILDNESERLRMATNCRRIAVTEYDSTVQARRYLNLYSTLLAS